MSMWWKLVWIGCGGAIGAMSRYSTTVLAMRWFGPKYPWGTMIVNLLGCFVMGVAFALSYNKVALTSDQAKLFLMVGFLGAFTTFSSFALDSVLLLRQQSLTTMMMNMGLQNILGLLLVVIGMWIVQILI